MFLAIHSKVCLKKTFPAPPFLFNQRDLTQPPVQSPLRPSFHSPKRPAFLFFCLGIVTFFFVACSGTSSDKTNSTSNTTDRDTEQECSIQNGEGKKTRSVTEGEEPEAWDLQHRMCRGDLQCLWRLHTKSGSLS